MYEFKLLKGQPLENSIRGTDMETYVGYINARELIHRYQIPRKDPDKPTGYQRLLVSSRVNKLAKALHGRHVDLPTALLLSVREDNIRPKLESSGIYVLSLPDNGNKPFYVVDGQHRLDALRKLIEDEQDAYWSEYLIPAVIFFGADEYIEMDQFYTVNFHAKSPPTNLAHDLLTAKAQRDERFRKYILETTEGWKVTTHELTKRVSRAGVWRGRIRFASQKSHNKLITSNSFASSLRRVIGQDNFASYLPEERAKIIDSYWRGIAKALPDCFRKPDEYNIQKTVGVNVLHDLLPTVLTWTTRFSCPEFEPATYQNLLGATLENLTGDNSKGGESAGSEFWKIGAEGASGAYSGGAGRRVLGQRIKRELEDNLRNQLN